jgi:membrane associated rhomboid family serine protease
LEQNKQKKLLLKQMISQELKYKLVKSDVSKIFFIAISLFLFVLVIKIYFQLNGNKNDWFEHTFYPYIGISNSVSNSMQHIWVLFIHFFVEQDIKDVISNILWLYFFGFILEDIRGANSVFTLFIIAGFFSGIVVLICVGINANFLPFQYYLGMKAPLMAIAAATIAINPHRKVFVSFNGGIPIYIVGVLFALLTMFTTLRAGVAPIMAEISGIMIGLLFYFGLDIQIYKLQELIKGVVSGDKKPSPKPKQNNNGYKIVSVSPAKIDELLDKINSQGINSLTAQEREWLKNYSDNK